jgi:hypothetical protein
MNKSILFALAVLALSCNQPAESLDTSKNKELFNKNVDSFKKKFVAGFKSEDQGLMMSLFADSLKWNNPEAVSGVYKSKQDLSKAIDFYLEEFDDITFLNDVYFGGSHYSSENEASDSPNAVRIFGDWNTVHTSTNTNISHKWMAIIWFNEDGEVHQFIDYFDVSGLALQIEGKYSR